MSKVEVSKVEVSKVEVSGMNEPAEDAGADPEMKNVADYVKITKIACLCHEANRALCEMQGDTSQAHWRDAPKWQRESAVAGVLAVTNNYDVTPAQLHEKWSEHKRAEGWVYGPVKDADAKTHPCLVPYEHLPFEQQAKDAVFGAIVRAALLDSLPDLFPDVFPLANGTEPEPC